MGRMRSKLFGGMVVCLGGAWVVDRGPADAPTPLRPTLRVRVVRPDEQLARVLTLFDGAEAPHPAAALAAWRRATDDDVDLGKATQALITMLNPEMVRELRTLRDAEFALGFDPAGADPDPERDRPWWIATLPNDDGTIGALATALALTDGAHQPALEGAEVDRLGPPGSPLMARQPAGGVALASDRAVLDDALALLRAAPPDAGPETGWVARLDVSALAAEADGHGDRLRRRVAEGLRSLGCREAEAWATLEGESLGLVVTGRYEGPPPRAGTIDPSWLDWVPADRTAAALTFAADPDGATWDAAFALADRVERVDPDRARRGPVAVAARPGGPRRRSSPRGRPLALAARGDGLHHRRRDGRPRRRPGRPSRGRRGIITTDRQSHRPPPGRDGPGR